jgi:hypothetical protein
MMKKNMGSADRISRIVMAIVIAFLYMINVISGTFIFVFLVVIAVLAITSAFSFCPIYVPFGINTLKRRKN